MTFFNTAPTPRSRKYLKMLSDGKIGSLLKAIDEERAGKVAGDKDVKVIRLGVKYAK